MLGRGRGLFTQELSRPGPASTGGDRRQINIGRLASICQGFHTDRYIQTQHSDLIRREWRPGTVTQPVSHLHCSLVSQKELFGRLLPYCKCIVSCCRISGRSHPVVVHSSHDLYCRCIYLPPPILVVFSKFHYRIFCGHGAVKLYNILTHVCFVS